LGFYSKRKLNRIYIKNKSLKKLKEDGSIDTEKFTLRHTLSSLENLLGMPVQFANDCIGTEAVEKAAQLKAGEVLLLENLRFYKEEEKGDPAFAEKLSKLGDIWVNDAFGTAHRAHASTAVIARFFPPEKRMFGLLMEGEVNAAENVLNNNQQPFTAIIGGAKVSDKILIIENLLEKATDIIIGGGMAYTFFKAEGGEDVKHDVNHLHELFLHLVGATEKVCIVLGKSTHTQQAM